MSEHSTFSANELLRHFLLAPSEAESAKFLAPLVETHALPMIETILRAKFGGEKKNADFSEQDYEDLRGECCLKIIGALRLRKEAAEAMPIVDFPAYSAMIIYNVWNDFVRERSPNRENLKNKIRYVLDKDNRFTAAMDGDGDRFHHLQPQHSNPSAVSVEGLTRIIRGESEFFPQTDLPKLLAVIFEKADGGLTVEKLVRIIADLWQVRDLPAISLEDFYKNPAFKSSRRDGYEMRCKLEDVWREIRFLPVMQRVALLYNLRDERGGEILYWFFNTRVAELAELAEAMNLTRSQFVEMLPQLPLDDRRIAAAMNLTAKQIGNLRKVARDNLRRRLDGRARRNRAPEADLILNFAGENDGGVQAESEFLN